MAISICLYNVMLSSISRFVSKIILVSSLFNKICLNIKPRYMSVFKYIEIHLVLITVYLFYAYKAIFQGGHNYLNSLINFALTIHYPIFVIHC